MEPIINKSMDREDLLCESVQDLIEKINNVLRDVYSNDLYTTSWYGSLPGIGSEARVKTKNRYLNKLLSLIQFYNEKIIVGEDNRGEDYTPLKNAFDDNRIPWYLYWEIVWVLTNGPSLDNVSRVLDAGGTSSLFTCYLASLGLEVHSIDMNERLVKNGNEISTSMGWNMHSYSMNMKNLAFENEYFDHAYSICVFEHLEFETKQQALKEISRVLKPDGILSITFDFRNPAPVIYGKGPDPSKKNQLSSQEDIVRSFLSSGDFEIVGNKELFDNGKSYLVHPRYEDRPYTFASLFLKKVKR